jgi:hypothetical protein
MESVPLLGFKMKAKGLRGQGERVSQMLESRIPLAEDVSGVALSEVGTQAE